MRHKDWFDALVVVSWVSIWSLLVYFLPYAAV